MRCGMSGLLVLEQTPRAYSNSPSSWWCHPTISSSIVPFSSCLQAFPVLGSFQMSPFFLHQVSASASVLPMNIQSWFPLGWTGWISLHSKGLSRVSQHHSSKSSILGHSAFFIVQLLHPYMTAGKIKALTRHLLAKQCLCFLMCCLDWLLFFKSPFHFVWQVIPTETAQLL